MICPRKAIAFASLWYSSFYFTDIKAQIFRIRTDAKSLDWPVSIEFILYHRLLPYCNSYLTSYQVMNIFALTVCGLVMFSLCAFHAARKSILLLGVDWICPLPTEKWSFAVVLLSNFCVTSRVVDSKVGENR